MAIPPGYQARRQAFVRTWFSLYMTGMETSIVSAKRSKRLESAQIACEITSYLKGDGNEQKRYGHRETPPPRLGGHQTQRRKSERRLRHAGGGDKEST